MEHAARPSEPQSDPDYQAVVTDYVDVTEYAAADFQRSLNLIHELRGKCEDLKAEIHVLSRTYGHLPSIPPDVRPNAAKLRATLWKRIELLKVYRTNSRAESERLHKNVERLKNRVGYIVTKLESLPKPPSRDPTPAPTSPGIKRSQSGRKLAAPQKLTLNPPDATRHAIMKQNRARNQRVTVPGEVLPPINPDSPLASTEITEDEDMLESEPPLAIPDSRAVSVNRKGSKKPEKKELKKLKVNPPKLVPRTSRTPGMGTNVHSSVAGISTSNALAALAHKRPPEDAPVGGEHKPWTRLTELELLELRKDMKKNAIWAPSATMIRKTLHSRGRGWENFRKAKEAAQANGTELLDPEDIANWTPDRVLKPGEVGPDEKGDGGLSNRGMQLNQAKKRKKEKIGEENDKFIAELLNDIHSEDQEKKSAANTKLTMLRLENSAKNLANFNFSASLPQLISQAHEEDAHKLKMKPKATPKPKAAPKTIRSSEITLPSLSSLPSLPSLSSLPSGASTPRTPVPTEPTAKKRKKAAPAPVSTDTSITTTIPILPPGPASASKGSTPLASPADPKIAAASASKSLTLRSSAAPKAETPSTSTAPPSRPPSRHSAAASAEPSANATRESSRRQSSPPTLVAEPPTTSKPAVTAASVRSKRAAPGLALHTRQDGGAALSVSHRKAPTKKKGSIESAVESPVTKTPGRVDRAAREKAKLDEMLKQGKEVRVDEDGNFEDISEEPRYCVCNDVSWGEMIACEVNPCPNGEWFHFDCVNISEQPNRTTKWYCPTCRVKLNKGVDTNGLVGASRRR